MTSRSRSAFVLMLVIAGLCAPTLSSGGALRRDDPDDSGSKLDVVWVRHDHVTIEGRRFLVHRVVMHVLWSNRVLEDVTLDLRIDLDGDMARAERVVSIEVGMDGKLQTVVHGTQKGAAFADRPGPRTVRIFFTPRLLGRGRTGYRWQILTLGPGYPELPCEPDPAQPCTDRAPRRPILHRL